ncbi:MAG TPA: bacteriocin family protein [Clostridiaceae bacterium]|nr:bacteriocin family protein [Clostridiaceae bacterium]
MDYLSREGSPISADLWEKIDDAVVSAAKKSLTGRRFLSIYGPLGAGIQSINVDNIEELEETEGSISVIKGRTYQHIPLISQDFALLWRDLEFSEQTGLPVDLSSASRASSQCALKEDELIFFGNDELGYKGLLTEDGIIKLTLSDWSEGENPFKDISTGLAKFIENGIIGRNVLIVSPNLFVQLQRIQPGTGTTEYERISRLLNGNIFSTPVLKNNQAVLVCSEPQNMDLVIGQDMITSYLETKNLNHYFRIIETLLLRIKNKKAVIVFE